MLTRLGIPCHFYSELIQRSFQFGEVKEDGFVVMLVFVLRIYN